MSFENQTVLVTGSGRGIGARTARRFAEAGAHVVVADIDSASAQRVAASIDGSLALTVDVTSRDSVRDMVRDAVARFGGVDVLINNAATSSDTPFLDATVEEVQRDIGASLLGPFFACQEVIPGMVERGGGVILNVASTNGFRALRQ